MWVNITQMRSLHFGRDDRGIRKVRGKSQEVRKREKRFFTSFRMTTL